MPGESDEVHIRVSKPIQKNVIIEVYDMVDPEEMPRLMATIRQMVGHEKFLIVRTGEGQGLTVHGDDDVRAWLRSLVREEFDELLKEVKSDRGRDTKPRGINGPGLPTM